MRLIRLNGYDNRVAGEGGGGEGGRKKLVQSALAHIRKKRKKKKLYEFRISNRFPSLSGTFLQTLPYLVTPLKGHSLSPRSCPATRSAPSERFGYYYDCRNNLAPKHARKHEAHPPRVEKKFRLDSNYFGFICACISNVVSYKRNV